MTKHTPEAHQLATDPLLVLTLGEAARDYVYSASCSACRYNSRIDLDALAGRLGADFPLRELRKRLRCSQCRSRRIIISLVPRSMSFAKG